MILLLLFAAFTSATDAVCPDNLRVSVFDAATAEPVSDAQVVQGDATSPTDNQGIAVLASPCTSPQDITITHPRYQRAQRRWNRAAPTITVLLDAQRVARADDLVVYAKRLPALSAASALVSEREISARRGRGLADVLGDTAGVSILRSGTGAKPIVGGLYGRRLVLVFDGVRHEGQKWGLDHQPELDPFSVHSIEVLRGAGGVLFGPDAIGGALVLSERPWTDARWEASFDVLGMNDGPRLGGGGRVEGLILPDTRLRLEGSFVRGGAVSTPDYALDNTGLAQGQLGATLEHQADDWRFKLAWRRYFEKRGVCSCIRNESFEDFQAQVARGQPIGVQFYEQRFAIGRPRQEVTHDTAWLRVSRTLGPGRIEGTYAFQSDNRQEFDVTRSLTGPQFDFALTTQQVEVAWSGEEGLSLFGVSCRPRVGVQILAQDQDYEGLSFVPDYQRTGLGVYARNRLNFSWGQLSAGLRFDLSQQEAVLSASGVGRLEARNPLPRDCRGGRCDRNFQAWSAQTELAVPTRWAELLFAVSTVARFPNVDELYTSGTAPSFPVLSLGDPTLRPERALQASVGISRGWKNWATVRLSGYVNQVFDYVEFAPVIDGTGAPVFETLIRGAVPQFAFRNVDARFIGGEAEVTFGAPNKLWQTRASVTTVKGRNLTDRGFLFLIPSDRARLSFLWQPLQSRELLSVSAAGDLVRRQNRVDPLRDLAPPPAGYGLMSLSVTSRFRWHDVPYRVSLTVENLLNTRFRSYTSLLRYYADEPGRQIWFRAGFTI